MNIDTLKKLFHEPQEDKNILFKLGALAFFFVSAYRLNETYTTYHYAMFLISFFLFFRFVIRPVTIRYRMLNMIDELALPHQYFYDNTKQNLQSSLEAQGHEFPPLHPPDALSRADYVTPSIFLYNLPLMDPEVFERRYRQQSIYQRLYQRHQVVYRLQRLHLVRFEMKEHQMPISQQRLDKIQQELLDYRLLTPSLFLDSRYQGEKSYEKDNDNFISLIHYINAIKYHRRFGSGQ